MKRSIVRIDEDKCDGCGQCVPSCHEGAIVVIDGKARLVGDSLCDGLGACLGECPKGAIMIEEREAEPFVDPAALPKSEPVPKPEVCGCPGGMTRDFRHVPQAKDTGVKGSVCSQLRQWPVQLKLLNPRAPFFQDADIVISADCVAFSYGDFHCRFLQGKVLVVFCPKLDEGLQEYVEKLTDVFKNNNIRSVTIVRMEVPCCAGTSRIAEEAVRASGKNIMMKEYTISLQGEII